MEPVYVERKLNVKSFFAGSMQNPYKERNNSRGGHLSSIFLLRFVYEFTSMFLIWQSIQIRVSPSAREIAACKQNVEQKEDFMHSNFQMDISLPWIDAAFTQHLKLYLNIFIL